MSDHGNEPGWFYILLTIIVIGASLVRSVRKKFKETEQGPLSWEEEPAPQEAHPPFWYDKPAKPDRKPFLEVEYVEQPKYVPAAEQKEEKQNPLLSGLQEQEAGDDRPEFDLKKAIIYSEILHRKYD